jgi:protein TonB
MPFELAGKEPGRTGIMRVEVLHEPVRIPSRTVTESDEFVSYGERTEAPSMAGVLGGVAGGVAGGSLSGAVGGVLPKPKLPMLAKPEEPRPAVRISQGVSSGLLLKRVMPEYPMFARRSHVQGIVELQAIISKDGTVDKLKAISGSTMLREAAIRAVSQWRYRPYFLNGEPIEVETTISVRFTLNGD